MYYGPLLIGNVDLCLPSMDLDATNQTYKWTIHHAFQTECNNIHDWQSVGLIESWIEIGKPTNLTRIMSCDGELPELTRRIMKAYPEVTFFRVEPVTVYVPFDTWPYLNKPAGVKQWIHQADIPEDFVIITDPDWVLNKPWNISGLKKGHPLAADAFGLSWVKYPEFNKWCTGPCQSINNYDVMGPGHVYITHKDDMRQLATNWLNLTIEFRRDPELRGSINHMVDMDAYMLGSLNAGLMHEIRLDYSFAKPSMDFLQAGKDKPPWTFSGYHYAQPLTDSNSTFQWSKWNVDQDGKILDCSREQYLPVPVVTQEDFTNPKITEARLFFEVVTKLNSAFMKFKEKSCSLGIACK